MIHVSGAVAFGTESLREEADTNCYETLTRATSSGAGCANDQLHVETVLATRRRRRSFDGRFILPRCNSRWRSELSAGQTQRSKRVPLLPLLGWSRHNTAHQPVSLSVFSIGSITNIGNQHCPAARYGGYWCKQTKLPRQHWEAGLGAVDTRSARTSHKTAEDFGTLLMS